MMRPHCDRCDALCDGRYPTWIEDGDRVWHINIGDGLMFCRPCRVAILEEHVRELKEKQT